MYYNGKSQEGKTLIINMKNIVFIRDFSTKNTFGITFRSTNVEETCFYNSKEERDIQLGQIWLSLYAENQRNIKK